MVNGSISSHLDDMSELNGQVDSPTSEDFAWADSCMIEETHDISDSNWNDMKDALLEILGLHCQKIESFAAASKDDHVLISEAVMEIDDTQNCDNFKASPFISLQEDSFLPIYNDELGKRENIQNGMSLDFSDIKSDSPLFSLAMYPFLPTYTEAKQRENGEAGPSHNLSETNSENPADIFRVWDLNIPAVEVELVEQLNKALSDNHVQTVDGNFGVLKNFEEGSIHDLILGISDMSLG